MAGGAVAQAELDVASFPPCPQSPCFALCGHGCPAVHAVITAALPCLLATGCPPVRPCMRHRAEHLPVPTLQPTVCVVDMGIVCCFGSVPVAQHFISSHGLVQHGAERRTTLKQEAGLEWGHRAVVRKRTNLKSI